MQDQIHLIKTTAIKTNNNTYILNGTKSWISLSPIANIFIIWAKDISNNNKIKGLTTPIFEGIKNWIYYYG